MRKPKDSEKTGGRIKCTSYRTTASIREWLVNLIGKNQKQIEKDLKELEPMARLNIITKILPFAVPKMQEVNATIDIDKITDEQLDMVIDEITKDIDDDGEEKE